MMRATQLMLLFMIYLGVGCNPYSPNKYQVETTLEKLPCYQLLITCIKDNPTLQKQLIEIRDSRLKGPTDVYAIDRKYRFIELSEFQRTLPKNWIKNCNKLLGHHHDLRGIRYINSDLIIIEVDYFDRRTLDEYSMADTYEFHRLIFAREQINRSMFYDKTEKLIWKKELEDHWMYEVSHRKYLYFSPKM
ncbi:MAG: hypothetical protein ACPGJS_17070 [Flammeovirgaceae bacterium]